MLNIEKTLQSVRDLLDRLGKEGVEFALVESEYSDYVADIRDPNKVYVFLDCSIRPNGTFVWRDYDHHKGVCDFDEFRVRIITLTANKYLDKAKDKRKQWASLCEGTDTPMPDSLAVTVSDMENKANRLKALLEPDDPPLLDGRDIAILKELKPYGVVKPAEESQRLRELGVLERRYYIDQVFDALTDKGEKALEFASHVERTKKETNIVKTASFHTTARKAILATLQTNRDDLRVHDTREWRFLTDEEFRRLGHAKPSDVSYAGDLDDYGMFDGAWRAAVDCGDALPHASEYSISGMLIAFDDKTVWETVCAGLDLLVKE